VTDIILATINARYHHASLGLRYLKANLAELEDRCELMEFTLEVRAADIAEQLLSVSPLIVGLGVYIWNVEESHALAAVIKKVAPLTKIVLGGPEVGFVNDLPDVAQYADYIIAGQADFAFRDLCRSLLDDDAPPEKFIQAVNPKLQELRLPYDLYTDEDLRNRLIYVEASRGCPFKCEFCISSLDRTAWNFDLDRFLIALDSLYDRGLRNFKFVDRTFNLKLSTTRRILEYFLEKEDPSLFLHFELIPDRLPDALREYLLRFREGMLQFEIGVQTFNFDVQNLISRQQDDQKTIENMGWITSNTQAHVHADLIFGLPGEDLASFGRGFNKLHSLGPHEIQLGILKRLRGTPIIRHEKAYQLCFDPLPPYSILSTSLVDFATTQRIQRFARYWDLIANSGRFGTTLKLLPTETLFESFLNLSDWLYEHSGKTHRISLTRLFELLLLALVALGYREKAVTESLLKDFENSGHKGRLSFSPKTGRQRSGILPSGHNKRQTRHQIANQTA